jgi:3-dehydroquinate synthase
VIKYGVIHDEALFGRLEQEIDGRWPGNDAALSEIIARSCAIKAEVVGQDERDGGLRAILNFGHTLGHALEKVAGYGTYLHGEAVGVGMAFAARLSARVHGLARGDQVERIVALVQPGGTAGAGRRAMPGPMLRHAMEVDKKGSGGQPRFVLADRIGHVAGVARRRSRCWRKSGMPAVSETIVREYLESLGFLVQQPRRIHV